MTKEQKFELRNKISVMESMHEDFTRARIAYEKAEAEVHDYISDLPEYGVKK